MNKNYHDSLSDGNILNNRVAKKMLEWFTPFEVISTLRRYNIGSARDNEPAFWFMDENNEPYSLVVDGKEYFGTHGIWNHQVLDEPGISKIGICDSPEQAFWATMYTRRFGVSWVYLGPATDYTPFKALSCFAIVRDRNGRYATTLKNIPGIRYHEYDDFKEELFITGKPVRHVSPPDTPVKDTRYSMTNKLLSDPRVKNLMERLNLEIA